MQESNKWKNWVAIRDSRICEQCKNRHGKIYALSEVVKPPPPLHMYCRCKIKRLNSIFAGEANLNEAIRTDLEALKIVLFFVASFRHTSYCQKLSPRKDTHFQGLEVQRILELANFR